MSSRINQQEVRGAGCAQTQKNYLGVVLDPAPTWCRVRGIPRWSCRSHDKPAPDPPRSARALNLKETHASHGRVATQRVAIRVVRDVSHPVSRPVSLPPSWSDMRLTSLLSARPRGPGPPLAARPFARRLRRPGAERRASEVPTPEGRPLDEDIVRYVSRPPFTLFLG